VDLTDSAAGRDAFLPFVVLPDPKDCLITVGARSLGILPAKKNHARNGSARAAKDPIASAAAVAATHLRLKAKGRLGCFLK